MNLLGLFYVLATLCNNSFLGGIVNSAAAYPLHTLGAIIGIAGAISLILAWGTDEDITVREWYTLRLGALLTPVTIGARLYVKHSARPGRHVNDKTSTFGIMPFVPNH